MMSCKKFIHNYPPCLLAEMAKVASSVARPRKCYINRLERAPGAVYIASYEEALDQSDCWKFNSLFSSEITLICNIRLLNLLVIIALKLNFVFFYYFVCVCVCLFVCFSDPNTCKNVKYMYLFLQKFCCFLLSVILNKKFFFCFRDCGYDSTCVLCIDCFQKSIHKNHHYKVDFIFHL